MKTLTIFQRANDNRFKRIVMDVKDNEPLYFNPRSNPNLEIYQQPLKNVNL